MGADTPYTGRVRGAVEGGRPVTGRGALPLPGDGGGHGFGAYVGEAGADQAALEVGRHGPETGRVQGRGVAGDVEETGRDEATETGERREVEHAVESRSGDLRVP